jgi:hypothetical protein
MPRVSAVYRRLSVAVLVASSVVAQFAGCSPTGTDVNQFRQDLADVTSLAINAGLNKWISDQVGTLLDVPVSQFGSFF